MDLPPWTLQPPVCGAQCWAPRSKKFHHNAAQLCARQGLQFIPLVVEACGGGWGPTAVATSENWALCTLLDLECLRVMAEQLFEALPVACYVRTCRPSSDGSPSHLTVCHPTARTSPCVISKAVCDPVAQEAIAIRTCNRNTEPQTEQYPKKDRVQVKTKGRRWAGLQPCPAAGCWSS